MQEISYVRTKSGKSPRIKFKDIKAREQNDLRFFFKRAAKTIKIMDNRWLPESFKENKTHKHTYRIFGISNGLPRQELFTIQTRFICAFHFQELATENFYGDWSR